MVSPRVASRAQPNRPRQSKLNVLLASAFVTIATAALVVAAVDSVSFSAQPYAGMESPAPPPTEPVAEGPSGACVYAWPYVDRRCVANADTGEKRRSVRVVSPELGAGDTTIEVLAPAPVVDPGSEPPPPEPTAHASTRHHTPTHIDVLRHRARTMVSPRDRAQARTHSRHQRAVRAARDPSYGAPVRNRYTGGGSFDAVH